MSHTTVLLYCTKDILLFARECLLLGLLFFWANKDIASYFAFDPITVFQLWTLSIGNFFFKRIEPFSKADILSFFNGIPIYDNLFLLWTFDYCNFLIFGCLQNPFLFVLLSLLSFRHEKLARDWRGKRKKERRKKAFVTQNVFSSKSQLYHYPLKQYILSLSV